MNWVLRGQLRPVFRSRKLGLLGRDSEVDGVKEQEEEAAEECLERTVVEAESSV